MFTVVFFVEFLCKFLAYGFCIYIKTGWNRLDFMVVTVSLIDICFYVARVTSHLLVNVCVP